MDSAELLPPAGTKPAPRPGSRFISSLLLAVLLVVAVSVVGLKAAGFRVGIDVQRLIGEPACMPTLVYLWHKPDRATPLKGDYVVARMPETGMGVGARKGDRIVKKVMATEGDRVRIQGTELWINEQHTERLWLAKSIPGRAPGDFDRDSVMGEHEMFLMGTTKESFDSRYWGTLRREQVLGYAIPLL
ncbi:S26 family signal peptidase [Acidovorax sp. sic0104]|uniref:S26 family signal peptidase n=1 Tax=Acidovorax sp. sic0104 TaxID=2854784 RepID=UPI001C491A61|nr:S26 family signal peptidase [Acidovorax sp. sic0104]MBV7542108.1 S26 family signal peptidase [Acidovorax sp. sic0104]